jgi:hypothetical protein
LLEILYLTVEETGDALRETVLCPKNEREQQNAPTRAGMWLAGFHATILTKRTAN